VTRLFQAIWYVLTLRCEEADRIRAVGRREDLTHTERLGAWLHALICRACWAARKQADRLDALISSMREADVAGSAPTDGRRLSAEAEARLLDAIDDSTK